MKKIGRYDVVEELGRGAMGVVYKASDPTIGRLVAIKVLSLEASAGAGVPGAREIFMREARAAGRLSHPGIVTIHDALEDPESRSNYIVMEFIPGRTLESILLAGPALETDRALDIIRQIAEALDYAHHNQIIHRDLKPANILLTDDGRVKITDFGIAKIVAREGAARTVAIMGTPAYMSPEQVTGGEIDARSDLFSMGILLYLMLVGQRPFAGDTVAVMFKIVYEDPVLPSRLNRQLQAGHDYLVMRCLAKDRTKRYTSAREFLDDFEDVRQGRAPRSEARIPFSELRVGERTMVAQRPFVTPEESKRAESRKLRHVFTGAIAGVSLVAVLGLGVWWFRQRGKVAAPPAPAEATAIGPSPPPAPAKGEATLDQPPPPAATTAVARTTKPTGTQPSATKPVASQTRVARVVQLVWEHDLKEARLSLRSGTQVIYEGSSKGRKKGGLLRGKGYATTASRPITIPAGARQLSIRVRAPDGSLDLSDQVSALAPAHPSAALHVAVKDGRLVAGWQTAAQPAP
jgi:serine/threonine-protein kinase